MPSRMHILLLLVCCFSLTARAQTTNPGAPAHPLPSPEPVPGPAPVPAGQVVDPCAIIAEEDPLNTCYADQFRLIDQQLNRIYRNTILAFERDMVDAQKHADDSQMSYDATALSDLKAAQAQWMKYRDLQCNAAGQQAQGGYMQPVIVVKCMALVTSHRIDEIRAAYEIGNRNLE
jgi:uncharacterized protein YecT (DUF1311 family)